MPRGMSGFSFKVLTKETHTHTQKSLESLQFGISQTKANKLSTSQHYILVQRSNSFQMLTSKNKTLRANLAQIVERCQCVNNGCLCLRACGGGGGYGPMAAILCMILAIQIAQDAIQGCEPISKRRKAQSTSVALLETSPAALGCKKW